MHRDRLKMCLCFYLLVYLFIYLLNCYFYRCRCCLYIGNGRVIGAPLRMRRPEDQSPSAASAGLMMEVVRHYNLHTYSIYIYSNTQHTLVVHM